MGCSQSPAEHQLQCLRATPHRNTPGRNSAGILAHLISTVGYPGLPLTSSFSHVTIPPPHCILTIFLPFLPPAWPETAPRSPSFLVLLVVAIFNPWFLPRTKQAP